jgi:hypothetical protein
VRRRFPTIAVAFAVVALAALAACSPDAATQTLVTTTTTAATPQVVVSPAEALTFIEMAVNEGKGDVDHPGRGQMINKWQGDPRLGFAGAPTADDRALVAQTVARLNPLIAPRKIVLDSPRPNVVMHFVPKSAFGGILRGADYPADADGVTQPILAAAGARKGIIDRADIAIDSTIPQAGRNHVITHELFHALGVNHSGCKSSIMYPTGGNDVSPLWSPSALDQRVLSILYRPEIEPGMKAAEVVRRLSATAPTGAECTPVAWQLIVDAGSNRTYFCHVGPERYRPCTSNVATEPTDPLPNPDLFYDGQFLYDNRPGDEPIFPNSEFPLRA